MATEQVINEALLSATPSAAVSEQLTPIAANPSPFCVIAMEAEPLARPPNARDEGPSPAPCPEAEVGALVMKLAEPRLEVEVGGLLPHR